MISQETLTIFNNNPEYAINIWKGYPLQKLRGEKYSGCYSGFTRFIYQKGMSYYFAFPYQPVWIEQLINELNIFFDNIHYSIVANKEVNIFGKNSYWGIPEEYDTFESLEKTTEDIKKILYFKTLLCPLFTVSVSDKYNEKVIPHLYYILHHLIRINSYKENGSDFAYCLTPPTINPVEHVLSFANKNMGYRSLAEIPLNLEDLRLLDNPELVNKYLDVSKEVHLTQTEIFMNLNWDRYCKFPKMSDVVCPITGRKGKLLCIKKSGNFYVSTKYGLAMVTKIVPQDVFFSTSMLLHFRINDIVIGKESTKHFLRDVYQIREIVPGSFTVTLRNISLLKLDALPGEFNMDIRKVKKLPKTRYADYGLRFY